MAVLESTAALGPIREKVEAGERLDLDDGVALLESDDLLALGELADLARRLRGGTDEVYFVQNLYLNATNVCRVKCKFCAFAATRKQEHAYTLTPDELVEDALRQRELTGFTEIHMVNGENPHVGLDYYVEGLDRDLQRMYFTRQLALARDLDLPLILHARHAVDDVIAAIRRTGGLRGVVHSFSGSAEQARQLWDLGFLLGIGGPVTYERARRLRGIVAAMPLDFLLLETDAPDQPLHGHRGERNEPACLREVAAVVAGLRGIDADALAAATTANSRRLFRIA